MAGLATVFGPGGMLFTLLKHCPGSKLSLAKPQPPWLTRELVLKSVLLPRTVLQFISSWSAGFCLSNIASSDLVWRGPVPKMWVTPSVRPSRWHDPQLLHASFDILPLKFR